MDMRHIPIEQLTVSAANMRGGKQQPDVSDILPSIRQRGILVPLIVRASLAELAPWEDAADPQGGANDAPTFEIVAGRRRYHAALSLAKEARECGQGTTEPLPCVVIAPGDDAAALEASILENVARLAPDEVTRWQSFTRLVKEGRTVQEVALTFGLTELQVKRTLALGNLLPRIRNLYREGSLNASTVQQLTLASKSQQREWLKLLDDEKAYCPTGMQLKNWLFGGAAIPVSAALFDLDSFSGEIVSDLFGEDRYFASADAFWQAQMAALDAKAEEYRASGWKDVITLERGQPFFNWEHERVPKSKGGKVYIAISHRGDVTFHEGYVSCAEARRIEQGQVGAAARPPRPELTAPLANYVDLHRQAAARAALARAPQVAVRMVAAHLIVGSGLWQVRVEPQRAMTDAIAESVETCASETEFDTTRRAALALLGFDPDAPTVVRGYDGEWGISGLFAHLLRLSDEAVLDVLAVAMAETLEQGTLEVEALGAQLGVDMAVLFKPDETLLGLIKDREVLDSIVAEVARQHVAEANAKATGKVKRDIIRDCLEGTNGRAKVENWVPRWMAFPPAAYTERGGVGTVARAEAVVHLFGEGSVQADEQQPGEDAAEGAPAHSHPARERAEADAEADAPVMAEAA